MRKFRLALLPLLFIFLLVSFSGVGVFVFDHLGKRLPSFSISTVKAQSNDAAAVQEIIGKFVNILENFDKNHPFYNTKGIVDVNGDGNNDSLSDVEAFCWQNDPTACAKEKVKVIVGTPPPTKRPDSTNMMGLQETWADYRRISAVWNFIIAKYHAYKIKYSSLTQEQKVWHQERIAPHVYNALLNIDILTTGPEDKVPLSGFVDLENQPEGSIYTLRDTIIAERRLSDATGLTRGLIDFYEKGLIPQTYCTTLEKPYDSGKNCKTIDLRERMKTIFSCIMAKNEIHWMYDNQNPGQLRKKYYDLNAMITAGKDNYRITPNTFTDYQNGIGRKDLAGRSCHALPQNADYLKAATWYPNAFFYNGQMVTLLFMANFFKKNFPGLYPSADLDKIIVFTKNVVSLENAINLTNQGSTPGYFNDVYEFSQTN